MRAVLLTGYGDLDKLEIRYDIAPVVAKTFPLDQIAAAKKYFVTKHHTGKIVLTLTDGE